MTATSQKSDKIQTFKKIALKNCTEYTHSYLQCRKKHTADAHKLGKHGHQTMFFFLCLAGHIQ